MVVLGGWLDSMVLEVFSSLRFYDSFKDNTLQSLVATFILALTSE